MMLVNSDKIQSYLDDVHSIKERLEATYSLNLFQGDLQQAYDTLLKMMQYGCIDELDPRVVEIKEVYSAYRDSKERGQRGKRTCKTYGLVDVTHTGCRDYRTKQGWIRDYIYANVPDSRSFSVKNVPYWGTSFEGTLQGAKEVSYRVSEIPRKIYILSVSTSGQAAAEISELSKLFNKFNMNINENQLYSEVCTGVLLMYSIENISYVDYHSKRLGWMLCGYDESATFRVMQIIDYENVFKNMLDLDEFNSKLKESVDAMFGELNPKVQNKFSGNKYRDKYKEIDKKTSYSDWKAVEYREAMEAEEAKKQEQRELKKEMLNKKHSNAAVGTTK